MRCPPNALVSLLAALAVAAWASLDGGAGVASAESSLLFRSPGRFQIIAPDSGWTLERKRKGPRHLRMIHGVKDEGFRARLEVRVIPVPAPPRQAASRPAPTAESLLVEQAARQRLQVESQRAAVLGGEPAVELILLSPRKALQIKQVGALRDGALYVVEATARTANFAKYLAIFDDVIRTFAFL